MKKFSVAIAVLSAGLFGLATPVSKVLLENLNSFQLAGLLYLGAAAGLLPFAWRRSKRRRRKIDRRTLFYLAGTIFFGGLLGPVLLLFGLKMAKASSVSLWLNLELAATAVLGWLLFKDHLDGRGWLGVCGAILAGVLITIHEGQAGALAAVLVGLACLCWGFDNHFTVLIDILTPAQMTFLKGLIAGSINFAIGMALNPKLPGYPPILAALIVGAFSYGISIVLYITAGHFLGTTRSQIIFATAPFFGAIFSVIFLSEPFSGTQTVAAVILAFSIGLLLLGEHSHFHVHDEAEHVHMHEHADSHHDHEHLQEREARQHSHFHTHKKRKHSHGHYPDLHHRHEHHDRD